MSATDNTAPASRRGGGMSAKLLVVTAFMLFSMYFGAGNLIFPPYLAVEAGENFTPAILGFLGTAVVLPVVAIIAIAISGSNVRDLAARGGYVFGLIFPILAYLSIGAFYALPRTGAVSFSTAISPLTGWDSVVASGVFNVLFFGIALLLAYNPSEIVNRLGQWLTPLLLILLALLVFFAFMNFDGANNTPAAEKYASAPFAGGLLEGYLTMDSIASLAFGIVVINALRYKGVSKGKLLVTGTIQAGVIAGVILAVIYLGLGFIGHTIPHPEKYSDGAGLLAGAAHLTMGTPGQIIFGLIVLLACMTTAVGLIAATSEFFNFLMPGISYRVWAIVFAVASAAMATMGLETVLSIAAPVIGFIYPPAIALVLITLIEPLFRGKPAFYWTYRIGIWVAVIWSAIETITSLGVHALAPLTEWAPMADLSLGWVLPTVIGVVVGFVIDLIKPHPHTPSPLLDELAAEDAEKAAHNANAAKA